MVANAGDSRAVLGRADGGGNGGQRGAGAGKYGYDRGNVRGGGGGQQAMGGEVRMRAVDLSHDHNPHRPDEAARIR